ncbi:MAG TPA: nucleotidyltransferase domain-containing protein [Isosphaeraceae bacterium]|nr:nucleotidyltransferase domain-containing protein [Isosphaeraceae bacterium]
MIHPLIDPKRTQLEELCRRYHVRTLELFGSAVGGRFDPKASDLDFLVEYQDVPEGRTARSYFGLLAELRDLFGREVDLVETVAIRNPYFLRAIARERLVVSAF